MHLNAEQARTVLAGLKNMVELAGASEGRTLEIDIDRPYPGNPDHWCIEAIVWSRLGSQISSFEFSPEIETDCRVSRLGQIDPEKAVDALEASAAVVSGDTP